MECGSGLNNLLLKSRAETFIHPVFSVLRPDLKAGRSARLAVLHLAS